MSIDIEKLALHKLKGEVGDLLGETFQEVLEGAKDDLKKFGKAIAEGLLEASLGGDEDREDQLLDQLKVLAEINRIRLEGHAWVTAKAVVKMVFKAVVVGIKAAI